MSNIKKIEQADRQAQMNKAFKYGSKEGENNNPYKALKPAMEAYKTEGKIMHKGKLCGFTDGKKPNPTQKAPVKKGTPMPNKKSNLKKYGA